MLNTAEPTMVPIPTSSKLMNTPMIDVNSSKFCYCRCCSIRPATQSGCVNDGMKKKNFLIKIPAKKNEN